LLSAQRGSGPLGLYDLICYIDPLNVEAFQLDYQFDPAGLQFRGIDFLDPYVQTSPPDLSQLSSGLIRDIAGAVAPGTPPPPGDVDIFDVKFLSTGVPFTGPTVFASSNDYVVVLDTDTGGLVTVGADDITPATCVPEPRSWLLTTPALALILRQGFRRRALRRASSV